MAQAVSASWWTRVDPVLGLALCLTSVLSLVLLIGTCLCVQRRKKQQQRKQQQSQQDQLDFVAVNGKCVLDETASPALSAVFINNNKLHQVLTPYYCTGSLPRHVEAAHGSPAHQFGGSASLFTAPNGSAATLPRRFSSGGTTNGCSSLLSGSTNPPRLEAQLSRSSQCDRELPPVPPPEPKLAGECGPEATGELIRSRIDVAPEEVVELEEEDDSQYDLIARAASAASPQPPSGPPLAPGQPAMPGPLPAASLAAMAASASAASLSAVPAIDARGCEVMAVARTLTSGTIDSDAGSEVDPLYACIRPGRANSASRLAAQGRSGSVPTGGQGGAGGGGLRNGGDEEEGGESAGGQLHVYSYIRKQMSSPVYQLLPRSTNALPNLPRSLRGSVESYASLGASYASHAAPTIPDRRYGQSEVDLVEQLRKNSAAASVSSGAICGASPGSSGGFARHRRRSQSSVLLRHAAAHRANWSAAAAAGNGGDGGGEEAVVRRGLAVDGRHAAMLDEERRHSQPVIGSDDILSDQSVETAAATREASYQRVTVRESLASLRARNALPLSSAAAAAAAAATAVTTNGNAGGLQSLSLTDDTSSLYERLDHSAGSHRRSFGPTSRHQLALQQPLLPPRSAALSEAGDFYAEISGDEEENSEAYGEGEMVSAAAVGLGPLRHSQSGPLRLGAAGGPVLPHGAGADRVMFEMRSFRHIDSDLDISQTGTPVSARRGFSRPHSPPPADGPPASASGMALAHQRRSLMTPLMERSIEGSLFDDAASASLTAADTVTRYAASSSSDYERLPIAASDGGATLAPLDGSCEAPEEEEDSEEAVLGLDDYGEDFDHSEAMTDSGLSYGASCSLPVLLPSPPLLRPQRFPNGGVGSPDSAADSSSGIASRASQSSSGEPSVTGSPPSHSSALSSASSGGAVSGGPLGAARVGRQLVTQLLHSFRRKAKMGAPARQPVPQRQRTTSDSSSIL